MGDGAWNAGHVNALVAAGGEFLVGSDTGGVWLATGADAEPIWVPVGDDWANPDVQCLAVDPLDPRHVIAGCRQRDRGSPEPPYTELLYETVTAAADPLRSWKPISVPAAFGTMWAVQVSARPHVLVCSTDSGVWWLALDRPTGVRVKSDWVLASNIACTGLALGRGGSPVVSSGSGGQILVGAWQRSLRGPQLAFTSATVTPPFPTGLGRSSLAASTDGNVLYVIATDAAGNQGAFATSSSAGHTWTSSDPQYIAERLQHLIADHVVGGQGWYNNCIGVSKTTPSVVAIGWQNGVVLSSDGGQQFSRLSGGSHIHDDVHAVYFDPRDNAGATLHVGSDGGIATTTDLGVTWSSGRSKTLRNLQPTGFPERNNFGASYPHPTKPGVVAAGWKDNGTGALRVTGEWVKGPDAGGDGAAGLFLADGALLYCFVAWGGAGVPAHLAAWDARTGTSSAWAKPGVVNTDGSRLDGLFDPVIAPVAEPSFRHPSFSDGKLMRAVGGFGQQSNVVYGLFYDTDVTAAEWRELTALDPSGTQTWAYRVAPDGHTIYVGCAAPAQVVCVDPSTSSVTTLADPVVAAGLARGSAATISHLELTTAGLFAVVFAGPTSVLLAMASPPGGVWARLDNTPTPPGVPGAVPFPSALIYGLAIDPWGSIFVATDGGVVRSSDGGATWFDASAGLPAMPHCADLRAVGRPPDGDTLYLSCWGRSLWQASFLPHVIDPGAIGHFGWNNLIGNLADGRLWQLGPHGPVPLGGDPMGLKARTRLAGAFAQLVEQVASFCLAMRTSSSDVRARTATDPSAMGADTPAHLATLAGLATTMAGSVDVLTEIPTSRPTARQFRSVAAVSAALHQTAKNAATICATIDAAMTKLTPGGKELLKSANTVQAAVTTLDDIISHTASTQK